MDEINGMIEKLVEERIQERDHQRIAKVKASNIKNYKAYRARNLEKCKEIQRGYYYKRKNRKLEEALAKSKNKNLEEALAKHDIKITLV